MSFLNESFWLAICFVIFIYVLYHPIKKALFNTLNEKINIIKEEIKKAEIIKHESEELLKATTIKVNKLLTNKQNIINDTITLTNDLFKKSQEEINISINTQKKEALNLLQNQYDSLYYKIKSDIMLDTQKLVTEYLNKTNNHNLSDTDIAKNINISNSSKA